jgi:hypothetical protein
MKYGSPQQASHERLSSGKFESVNTLVVGAGVIGTV